MHLHPLAWSVLLGLLLHVGQVIAVEPSLSSIRSTLSAYQSAIVDLVFASKALSIASNSTALFGSSGQNPSTCGLPQSSKIVGPAPTFVTFASVLDYKRTKDEALRWGDNTGRYPEDTSLSSYIAATFASPAMGPSGLFNLQTLLQATSERCLLGQSVAHAKLQGAASPASPLCLALTQKDKFAVRNALTNTTQEELVRTSVRTMINMRNDKDRSVAEESVVGLFDM